MGGSDQHNGRGGFWSDGDPLGPDPYISANFAGLSQIEYDDQPWPEDWVRKAHQHLVNSPCMAGILYRRQIRRNRDSRTQEDEKTR